MLHRHIGGIDSREPNTCPLLPHVTNTTSHLTLVANYFTAQTTTPPGTMTHWTTPKYTKILTDSLASYQQANSKGRASIIKEIKAKIRDAAQDDHKNTPDDLTIVK